MALPHCICHGSISLWRRLFFKIQCNTNNKRCRRLLFDSYKLCSTPYNLYIINIYCNIDCIVLFYWLYPWFLTLIFATFCVVLLLSCTLCTIAGNTNSVFCTGPPTSLLFTALLNVFIVVLVISLLFGIDFWFHPPSWDWMIKDDR